MAERVYAAVGFRDLGRILEYVPRHDRRDESIDVVRKVDPHATRGGPDALCSHPFGGPGPQRQTRVEGRSEAVPRRLPDSWAPDPPAVKRGR
jgi:hypothetical protein